MKCAQVSLGSFEIMLEIKTEEENLLWKVDWNKHDSQRIVVLRFLYERGEAFHDEIQDLLSSQTGSPWAASNVLSQLKREGLVEYNHHERLYFIVDAITSGLALMLQKLDRASITTTTTVSGGTPSPTSYDQARIEGKRDDDLSDRCRSDVDQMLFGNRSNVALPLPLLATAPIEVFQTKSTLDPQKTTSPVVRNRLGSSSNKGPTPETLDIRAWSKTVDPSTAFIISSFSTRYISEGGIKEFYAKNDIDLIAKLAKYQGNEESSLDMDAILNALSLLKEQKKIVRGFKPDYSGQYPYRITLRMLDEIFECQM